MARNLRPPFSKFPASIGSQQIVDPLPSLSLEGVQRALIIAPHPDDETLAAGGLIKSVLSRGGQVKVVMVTNGDGQPLAPLVLKSPPPCTCVRRPCPTT